MVKTYLQKLWYNFPDHARYPILFNLCNILYYVGRCSRHIALSDGTSYREPEHDDYSRFSRDRAETYRGEFWEMA